MALEIIWTETARDDLFSVLSYLETTWSRNSAKRFYSILISKIDLLKIFPLMGHVSRKKPIYRRLLITKHNTLYYRVEDERIFLLSLFDNRTNPDENPYL